MKYYHGTNYESGMRILRTHRFDNMYELIWDCSLSGITYAVSEEYDGNIDSAIRLAIEAGQIAAAHKNSQHSEIIVFEFDTETEEFEEDTSCENMCNCYQIDNDTLNKLIESGDIKVRVFIYHNAYEPYLRPFYLMSMVENPYYSFNDAELKHVCINIAKNENCWFYEDYIGCYGEQSELNYTGDDINEN